MGKQPTIFFFGVLFFLGLLIQIVTSSCWQSIGNEKMGEMVFYLGQDIGELCYIFVCRRLFKGIGGFVAVTEFAISLVLVDVCTIVFLNPLEVHISGFFGFIVAVIVVIARLDTLKNKNENLNI